MTDSPKPEPFPTKNRLLFARSIQLGRVVKHGNDWWNTVAGRKCNAALAEFTGLFGTHIDGDGRERAHLNTPGENWLDTYGKNGAGA